MCLVARDWEDFKFLEDLLYWERPIFFFGRGMLDHFLPIKQSMTNHVNSRTVDRKIICFMCAWSIFTLLLGNFLFKNFLSMQVSIESPKKVFTTVW